VAGTLDDLAAVYQSQGRTAEAAQLTERAHALRERKAQPPSRVENAGPQTSFRSEKRVAPADKPFGKESTPDVQPEGKISPDVAPPNSEAGEPAASSTPQQSQPAGEQAQSDWDVVPVFYGTDRDRDPNPKRLAYNADRAHRLELGRALVTVPKIHQVPQIERPWAIRIPYFDVTIYEQAEDPKKHFTLREIKSLTKSDFLRLVRARLAGSNTFKNHAIVFVHGYDTSFDNALYRTAQIAYDLHFDGAPFVYSWPSGGAVASYTYDRESAEGSEPYLRQFLDLVVRETGAKTISVIAHSMGNKALLDVLKDMNSAAPKGVVISQVILAAPDVDADNFANLAQQIKGLAKGVTLYAAANDRALLVSRNFWGHYRAGDVPATGPLVVAGVDTIDVTAASTDVFALNHSDYAQNNDLLTDIGKLIATGLRPPDVRFDRLKPVNAGKNEYWRYSAE
jgi:esterase/lipase superfamily enzyme